MFGPKRSGESLKVRVSGFGLCSYVTPEGPTYTTIMELGPQNRDGFFGA